MAHVRKIPRKKRSEKMLSEKTDKMEPTNMKSVALLVLGLSLIVIAIAAAFLDFSFLADLDPLPLVVTKIILHENVPCLPPLRLMSNFRLKYLVTNR